MLSRIRLLARVDARKSLGVPLYFVLCGEGGEEGIQITLNVSISYLKPCVGLCFPLFFLSPTMRNDLSCALVRFFFLFPQVCFGFANDQNPSFHSVFGSLIGLARFLFQPADLKPFPREKCPEVGDVLTQRRAASSETSFPSGCASNRLPANAAAVRALYKIRVNTEADPLHLFHCNPPSPNTHTYTSISCKQLTRVPNQKIEMSFFGVMFLPAL